MLGDFTRELERFSSILGDDTRRRIYFHALRSEDGVGADHAAVHFGIHRTVARLHLEKLVNGGLLTRNSVRTGKSGRPAIVYLPAAETLAGRKASSARHLASSFAAALSGLGESGVRLAEDAAVRLSGTIDTVAPKEQGLSLIETISAALEQLSRPVAVEFDEVKGSLCLRTYACPHWESAKAHPDVVCAFDRALLRAIASRVTSEFEMNASPAGSQNRNMLDTGAYCCEIFKITAAKSL